MGAKWRPISRCRGGVRGGGDCRHCRISVRGTDGVLEQEAALPAAINGDLAARSRGETENRLRRPRIQSCSKPCRARPRPLSMNRRGAPAGPNNRSRPSVVARPRGYRNEFGIPATRVAGLHHLRAKPDGTCARSTPGTPGCGATASGHCAVWCARQDSNLQPSGYEPPALTN
jgi:hypothetical protein